MASAVIPRIELGAELGRGAHSIVMRGFRDGHAFAVKLPLDAGTDAERELAHRRFLREAVALARVHDPSLPAVMEVGRTAGVPYLIMELAAGETLSERLLQGPMVEQDVIALGRHLAAALDAIHAAGLVHRDVKPDNVVFDVPSGGVRLVDLGSASLADGRDSLVGTRAYAAPELLSEGARTAGARTDLYSLGCVLAQCLGHWRSGQDAASLSRPLSLQALVEGGISKPVAEVIARLVARNPNERYPSAARLVEDLDALRPGFTVPVAPKRARLLGRGSELERMRRAWADSKRAGRILVLAGEPGTGKTRLAQAFLDDMRGTGTNILEAAVHPRDPRAFSVVRQLVDGYLKACEELPAAERARALARVRRLAGDLGPLLKLLSPAVARVFHDAPTIPASENAEQAFAEGLSTFLGKLFRELAPVVVVIDDIQWLDSGSRRVLSRAVQHLGPRTLLVLGARLGDDATAVERFVETILAPVIRVDLTPLSDDDAIELSRDYLAAQNLDAEVRRTILGLSDGTPLRVLEVLRTLVDEGVLLPHWGDWRLNADAVSRMQLPSHTTSLLRRRISTLDPGTRTTLTMAAAIGLIFEEDLLISVVGGDESQVASALAEAHRSQIVEPAALRTHRFIHHTVRDALLLDEAGLPEIHQRIAETLDAEHPVLPYTLEFEIEAAAVPDSVSPLGIARRVSEPDADSLYRVAFHFASGVPGRTPDRLAETNILAGRAAVARFDNERAIAFFESADRALSATSRALDSQVRLLLAEARLRLGAFDAALAEFRHVLSATSDSRVKATALIRIASLHDMQLDSTRAWEALEQAFRELGEKLPHESPRYALGSLRGWLLRRRPRLARAPRSSDRSRDEMLCALYYQTGRVAAAAGKPARLVLAALRSLEPAERIGPSAALAKSYQAYGFVLTVVGLSAAGARYLGLAENIGRELRDPIVYSHALQMRSVIAAWGGRFQDSLDGGAKCLLEYGHWRELGDYIFVCYNQFEIEWIRGRDLEAWRWLDLAVQRVNQHEGAPVVHELLLLGARAALVGLGRENDVRRLLDRLESVSVKVPRDSGLYSVTFAPRVALLTAKMDLGEEFKSLVAEFRALKLDPKRVHIIVVEYYLQVAQARVHACLRSAPDQRAERLAELASALADLKAAAKVPAFKAHAFAVEGYQHFFEGRREKALQAFDEAERLGRAETAPWVLYAVHRGRAHMLRSEGHADAAKDQAVLAESVAMEHGSVYRARWVREEFGLRPRHGLDASYVTASLLSDGETFDEAASVAPGGSRARRQLRALLRISQARAPELAPDHQARLVVDELVQALRAQRGFLFLAGTVAHGVEPPEGSDGGSALELVAGRDAAGRDLGEPEDHDRAAVRDALVAEPTDATERTSVRSRVGTTARYSAISAPLVVDDETVGVVYLDRPLAEGVFSEADGEVLAALAGQVSVALELTRTLRARERAQENLRNAEKMDAVARLAAGIAHDLNNMLSAIRLATTAMMTVPGAGEIVGEDVRTIQSALQRANELTKQLGMFSRGEFGTPQLVNLGASVERLLPVIAGLVGDNVRLDMRLRARVAPIQIDPAQIDQVLMNLAVNARDAMANGGTMTIETSEVTPDDEYLREHPRVKAGRYVCLTLSDTGHGIDEDVRQKIFEPYFTTKRERGGTGLGLASVYWIVSQNGGHIDVRSTVGVGTTFTLFFPKVEGSPLSERKRRQKRQRLATVLIVEGDGAAARELEETFIELGYRVLGARTGAEALGLVRRRDEENVDLLITDVVMPGMNGLELARELRKLAPGLGVLFVSGDTSGVLAARGILGGEVEFLSKPIPRETVVRRARAVLDRK